MIFRVSYGDQRLAITVQPAKQVQCQPSAMLLAQSLSKAFAQSLSQTLGGCA